MFIKFALRRNLIYPLQYIIWSYFREFINMIISDIIKLKSSYIYLPLMFLGEIFAGAILYCYEKKKMKTKKAEKKEEYLMSIKLIVGEKEEEGDYFVPLDNKIKIVFLIFLVSLFDHVQFLISSIEHSKFEMLSASFCTRLNGLSTLSAIIFYIYALKLPIYKHHKISLFIIGIFLSIIIITEFIFGSKKTSVKALDIARAVGLIIASQIFVSCSGSIEKYLFEYDYMDPFVVLMYEGIFGYLLSFTLFFIKNYLKEMRDYVYDPSNDLDRKTKIVVLVFSLFFYMILSGGKNLFRIVTNKIYSPMTKTLSDYVLNPIYLLYFFGVKKDFRINEKFDPWYFSINLLNALIISFFGCVYNEFIILFCCGLEKNTHDQISRRAANLNELTELTKFDDEFNEDEGVNDNSSNLLNEKKFS